MAELNFPSDTANGQPPAAGNPPLVTEYVAAGVKWTWNDTLGVWSSESGDVTQDLDYAPNGDNAGTVTITDGTPATIPVATDDVAGLFTGAEKQKLEGIPEGGGGEAQDLSYQAYNAKGVVEITDGTNATIPLADADNNMAGLFRGDEKDKLSTIARGATNTAYQNLGYTKNGNGAGTVTISNGNNATIPVVTNTVAGLMTGTQKQSLDGLRSNSQNDARYLRVDSNAPAQTRASANVTTFKASVNLQTSASQLFVHPNKNAATFILRNDGNHTYFLHSTASSNINTTFNSKRPFSIEHSTGLCKVNGSTGNFGTSFEIGYSNQKSAVIAGSTPKLWVQPESGALRWAALGIPNGGSAYGIATSNAFGGAADAAAASFFSYTDNTGNYKTAARFYSRSGSANADCFGIDVMHSDKAVRLKGFGSLGIQMVSKSTAGGNAARAVTFVGRTSSTYHKSGYISTKGEGTGTIQIRNENGSVPSIAAQTDTRNIVSSTPMPSAVNALKALNPSVLQLSSGAVVTSFPVDSTKINASFAVDGSETDLDEEGNPEFAGVDHGRLVPLLTKALQEALERIEVLEEGAGKVAARKKR